MDYPLGRKLQAHLEFFISQLEYEYESGRESVLEMLATIFSTFPQVKYIKTSMPLCFNLIALNLLHLIY